MQNSIKRAAEYDKSVREISSIEIDLVSGGYGIRYAAEWYANKFKAWRES